MFENDTEEIILERMLDRLPEDIDKRQGSVAYDLLSPSAAEHARNNIDKDTILLWAFPCPETPREFLVKRAIDEGLNPPEKLGEKATGEVTITGPNDTSIPVGTVCSTDDGFKFLTTIESRIIDSSIKVPVIAEQVGYVYNVAIGRITTIEFDVDLTVSNESEITGGIDIESDEALLERLLEFVQNPATSGNKYHYIQWAKSVNGVGAAECIPTWNGGGTVKVIIANDQKRAPNSELIQKTKEYIESQYPIGVTLTVEGAAEVQINVTSAISTKENYTLEEAKEQITSTLTKYLNEVALNDTVVRITKIGSLILSCEAVADYTTLTINNTETNIVLTNTQIPVLGTVTVS